ncbi:endonuclease NucS domain-containing protein [Vogesella indigofera]|uniref:endonuclease NucS domain-containing protein n=1 Tax=Vogesella indigofera TaxID=45465 RepID=UPI00234E04F6|nr:endonuclease NucS domain-containing protein [Vogesella indigofera]MDC7704704.1 endonuclease NucS [Vogesella indigofera]
MSRPAKSYYRVMLGRQSTHAAECLAGGFIGADFGIEQDLTGKLPDEWRHFNADFIPVFLASRPDKSKIAAGLACGALWTVAKGLRPGDVVLSPDGTGVYRVGMVEGEYYYAPGQVLPHRRRVNWLPLTIARAAMSEVLRNSAGSIGTVSTITEHYQEIEQFLAAQLGQTSVNIVATDPVVEDPVAFAMEKHLEDFLVKNWAQTELAQQFKIYEEDGELVGQQYATDAGPIDILAVSKDGQRLLVVELKRGRASDVVVGQILRYMGFVKEQIAEPHQTVEGAIIALDDDQKLRWALLAVPGISFYRYQVSFKLIKH